MNEQLVGFTENEISKNSQGGTEITKRSIANLIPKDLADHFQIIPSRVRELNQEKIRVYWAHDLAEDPEVNHLRDKTSRDRFHRFVFSSNWQLQEYVTKLNFPRDDKLQVIETPIQPLEYKPKQFNDTINLVYFSTPQRGLALLVPVFEELCKNHDNVHLHVFSSFKIYGWEESDNQFEPLYEKIRQHPKMTYYGFTEQSVLREKLPDMHILAYPNIWTETSCRVLMESMSAGLLCVHPNLGALPDTSGSLTSMYQYVDDANQHANLFYRYLDNAVKEVTKPEMQSYLKFVKSFADVRFNLDKIAKTWEYMLLDLKEKYPDVESRKNIEQMFVYQG